MAGFGFRHDLQSAACRRRCSPLVLVSGLTSRRRSSASGSRNHRATLYCRQADSAAAGEFQKSAATNPGEQVQTRPGRRRATSSANRLFPPAWDAYSLSAFHLISIYCRILTSYRGFTNQKCQLYPLKQGKYEKRPPLPMTLSGAENGTRTRDLNLGKECCSKTLKDSVFQGYATELFP